MSGHGHVTPNADGSKARCGGPSICPVCAIEAGRAKVTVEDGRMVVRPSDPPSPSDPEGRYRIALDALLAIRNLDRSKWTPEAIAAHEALTKLGWRP